MSFHQRTTSIRFEDVRGISLEQTIIERTLGIGDVLIGTAATGDTEVTFQGIAVPEEVQHMITTERDKRQKVARQSLQSVESSAFATGVVS
jgi:uncharacterized membrane protein YdbT with pleckstrin-like domain